MASIEIDGTKYKVLDSLGFDHSIGAYAREVQTDSGPKMAVKQHGRWRFWTTVDRITPLVEEIYRKAQEQKQREEDAAFLAEHPEVKE